MVFVSSKKLFSFLRYWIFCRFFPFLSTVSRFKGSDQKRNFSKHVLQLKETGNLFHAFFAFHYLVHKWGLGTKLKIELAFSWSLLKYLIFKSLLHLLAVLGYLTKLRRVMGLAFSADFLHIYSIKIFLIKYPFKWPSFTIWGVWPKGLRYVPGSNPTRH